MKDLIVTDDDFQKPKDYVRNGSSRKLSYGVIFKQNCVIEATKFPFLTQAQVKHRVAANLKKQYRTDNKSNKAKSDPDSSSSSKNDKQVSQPAKKLLVPLDINFTQAQTNGSLKKTPARGREKRHVTFNKELDICYRTPSEGSSTSTLKDRKNCLKDKNLPASLKIVKSLDSPRSIIKTEEMETEFEKLLNDKCSWSYRTQKVVTTNTLNAQKKNSSFALESTIMTLKLSGNTYDDPCELSSDLDIDSWSQDESQKKKSTQKKNSKPPSKQPSQKKGKNARQKSSRRKSNARSSTKNQNLKKINQIQINEDESCSSSDLEVLQTRYSVQTSKLISENGGCSIKSEKEPIREVPFKRKRKTKAPIIIQATACNGNEDSVDHFEDQYPTTNGKESTNSNNSDIFQLEYDKKEKESLKPNNATPTKEKPMVEKTARAAIRKPELENNNSEQESVFGSLSNNCSIDEEDQNRSFSDDPMVTEFLNGSFDLNTYKDSREHCKENFTRRENRKSTATMMSLDKEYLGTNISKTTEKETSEKPYLTMSADKSKGWKSSKDDKKGNKQSTSKNTCKSNAHIAKKSQKKMTDALYDFANFESEPKPVECINIESTDDGTENNRNTKKRSSSLAASRRIKAIEKFENSAPSSDSDVRYLGEEAAPAVVLKNIKKRLNRIAKTETDKESSSLQNETEEIYDTKLCNEPTIKKESDRNAKQKKPKKNKSLEIASKGSLLKSKSKKSQSFVFPDEYFNIFEDSFQSYSLYKKNNKNSRNTNFLKETGKKCKDLHPLQNTSNILADKKITKYRSWSDLEQELLNELENENPSGKNKDFSHTVVLKHEKIIQKNQNSKSRNWWEVSNTSMSQTLCKYAKEDSCNVQSECAPSGHKYKGKQFKSTFLNEIMPSNPKSALEKAIEAMEQCTAGVLKPTQIPLEKNLINDSLISEENSMDSFMLLEANNLQPDFDEIKEKAHDLDHQDKFEISYSKTIRNFNMKDPYSRSITSNSADISKDVEEPQTEPVESTNLSDLFPINFNPHDKVTKKLKLNEEKQETNEIMPDPFNTSTEKTCAEANEGEIFLEKEIEETTQPEYGYSILCQSMNENDNQTKSNSNVNLKIDQCQNLKKRSLNNIDASGKRRKSNEIYRSPTFRFKAKKDGFLTLKLCSNDSSTTVSSADFQKKIKDVSAKRDEVKIIKKQSNKAKEKYAKYIQDLSMIKLQMNEGETTPIKSLHCNGTLSQVENDEGKKNNLIAEHDSEIFSLSSSDTDSTVEKTGIGALCELFSE